MLAVWQTIWETFGGRCHNCPRLEHLATVLTSLLALGIPDKPRHVEIKLATIELKFLEAILAANEA